VIAHPKMAILVPIISTLVKGLHVKNLKVTISIAVRLENKFA